MDDPAEHALVLRALGSRLSNCVVWKNDLTSLRVRNDPDLKGLTPEGIKRELLAFVAGGGEIVQVREARGEYRDYRYYYKAILPLDGFDRGVFVEIVLVDDDQDFPMVALVNAHPQRS
ncbi:MAG TPA: hypothetical protein VGH33_13265 [Isosphaeraceae bacterium]|jgi:hypothetical protein